MTKNTFKNINFPPKNRPTQTQELARADAWVQENLIEEAEMLNDLELLQEEVQRLENELEKKVLQHF